MLRARSTTVANRCDMHSSSSPTPETSVAGAIAIWRIGKSSASVIAIPARRSGRPLNQETLGCPRGATSRRGRGVRDRSPRLQANRRAAADVTGPAFSFPRSRSQGPGPANGAREQGPRTGPGWNALPGEGWLTKVAGLKTASRWRETKSGGKGRCRRGLPDSPACPSPPPCSGSKTPAGHRSPKASPRRCPSVL